YDGPQQRAGSAASSLLGCPERRRKPRPAHRHQRAQSNSDGRSDGVGKITQIVLRRFVAGMGHIWGEPVPAPWLQIGQQANPRLKSGHPRKGEWVIVAIVDIDE